MCRLRSAGLTKLRFSSRSVSHATASTIRGWSTALSKPAACSRRENANLTRLSWGWEAVALRRRSGMGRPYAARHPKRSTTARFFSNHSAIRSRVVR
jgi:hypothetical protein